MAQPATTFPPPLFVQEFRQQQEKERHLQMQREQRAKNSGRGLVDDWQGLAEKAKKRWQTFCGDCQKWRKPEPTGVLDILNEWQKEEGARLRKMPNQVLRGGNGQSSIVVS